MKLKSILIFALASSVWLPSMGLCLEPQDVVPLALEPVRLETSKQVISRLNMLVDHFYSTSGFANKDELLAAVAHQGGSAAQAASILMEEKLEVGIARTSPRREDILKHGFLNYRQSGRIGGGAARGRDYVEGNYLGINGKTYAEMDPSLKPKSGYLNPLPGSGFATPTTIGRYGFYGDDHYIFDVSKLRNRISLTAGDSLNRRATARSTSFDIGQVEVWDQVYIPWERRELIIPLLATGLQDGYIGVHMDTILQTRKVVASLPVTVQRYLVQLTGGNEPNVPFLWTNVDAFEFQGEGALAKYRASWGINLDYIEVQIWDALNIDDPALVAFEFTKNPPTGAFLEELKRRGIEIRDARPNTSSRRSRCAERLSVKKGDKPN